ncbi:hypothetical protein [Marinifilum sp.]|uniref:hypothetical protein n=1 Tax=Marinifilum sp. TaxID=2033137 RepID=UPI003BA8BF25
MVCIIDDYFGDIGIAAVNQFASVFDLGLRNQNELPFKNEILENESPIPEVLADIRKVSGITCNAIPNQLNLIANSYAKNYPEVMSREGANMLYVCQKESVRLLQLFYVIDWIENVQNAIAPNESMANAVNKTIDLLFKESHL